MATHTMASCIYPPTFGPSAPITGRTTDPHQGRLRSARTHARTYEHMYVPMHALKFLLARNGNPTGTLPAMAMLPSKKHYYVSFFSGQRMTWLPMHTSYVTSQEETRAQSRQLAIVIITSKVFAKVSKTTSAATLLYRYILSPPSTRTSALDQ